MFFASIGVVRFGSQVGSVIWVSATEVESVFAPTDCRADALTVFYSKQLDFLILTGDIWDRQPSRH
ncbi:MAG: hypothetical protein J7641_09015 [Cyanobacteria bacterium SID2]|nr:hypothetical protein [Cyanobacteria bacterium SID2]MBP0003425.1 hypothetical protein [Cyanobacteria bacterium SBC]